LGFALALMLRIFNVEGVISMIASIAKIHPQKLSISNQLESKIPMPKPKINFDVR